MKRRLFLQLPLVTSALIAEAQQETGQKPRKAFKVPSGKNRKQEDLLVMGGRFDCKVSGEDTQGALCIYDTVRHEKGGPALHYHHSQDEWFYVMEGEFVVQVGEETITLKAGDSAFAPRKIPHAFAKTSEGEARMLVLFQPAGTMEDFFRQMSRLGKEIPKDQEKNLKELWRSHGMEIVGPPLTY